MRNLIAAALILTLCIPAQSAGKSYPSRLKSLREEAREIADALRKEKIKGLTPEQAADQLKRTVRLLKSDPRRSPEFSVTLEHLDSLLEEWPKRKYCADHPVQMQRAIARQIEFSAEKARSAEDLPEVLKKDLFLPLDVELESLFPTKITVKKFKSLGPIVVFLMKHRMSRPEDYKPMDVEEIFSGVNQDSLIVETGAVLKGRVSNVVNTEFDRDITFNIGPDLQSIHCEITPSWRSVHPVDVPENGDLVEVYGWSYYDLFHTDEEESRIRSTVWEIHPVHKVVILERPAP